MNIFSSVGKVTQNVLNSTSDQKVLHSSFILVWFLLRLDLLKWNISQPIINFFLSIHYPMNWKISPLDLAHTDECRKFANPVSSLEGFWRLFWELDLLLMLTPLWWLAMLLDLLLSMFSSSCYKTSTIFNKPIQSYLNNSPLILISRWHKKNPILMIHV